MVALVLRCVSHGIGDAYSKTDTPRHEQSPMEVESQQVATRAILKTTVQGSAASQHHCTPSLDRKDKSDRIDMGPFSSAKRALLAIQSAAHPLQERRASS